MTRCYKCEYIETYKDYTITKEYDRNYDPLMGEYFGNTKIFYTVYLDEIWIDSYTTLKKAKQAIDIYNLKWEE